MLTSKNLNSLDHQVQSQRLPSNEKSVLRQWEFVNMPKSRKTGIKPRETEDTPSSTKTISTTHPRFPVVVVENGILLPVDSTPPSNFDEILEYINQQRGSPLPQVHEHRRYFDKTAKAENEETVKLPVLRLLKEYEDIGYRSAYSQQFTQYPDNLGFNNGLSPPEPDVVEGIDLQEFGPYPVREKLGGSAVPTPHVHAIALAHMAGEIKRPGGNLIPAQQQAAYDAACLVYGRNKALESMGRADLPGVARVGTFVSNGSVVSTFAHYARTDDLGKTTYHQVHVTSTDVHANFQNFKAGRSQIRNLQDWTRENSYSLKKDLLDHYELSQAHSNEEPILDGNECSEYGNGNNSAGSSVVVGTQPSGSAYSRRRDRLTPDADMVKRVPARSSART